jgi:hypothetical protein
MTTAQIIILTIFVIGYLVSVFRRTDRDHNFDGYSFIEMFIFAFLVSLCCFLSTELNKYKKGYTCPELEKIENVYKIKE